MFNYLHFLYWVVSLLLTKDYTAVSSGQLKIYIQFCLVNCNFYQTLKNNNPISGHLIRAWIYVVLGKSWKTRMTNVHIFQTLYSVRIDCSEEAVKILSLIINFLRHQISWSKWSSDSLWKFCFSGVSSVTPLCLSDPLRCPNYYTPRKTWEKVHQFQCE